MKKYFIVLSVLLLILMFSSIFFVREGYQAIVLQFGEVITKQSLKPGIHFKIPFIQNVLHIDKRVLNLSSDSREVIAHDQKRLIVNYYVKYQIKDPVQFYRSTRTISNLESRLRPIIESNMREQIGFVPLISLLTEERSKVMHKIRLTSDEEAKNFGVDVIDVRVKRTDLPEENSDAIFRRMQTEREKEAKEIRAQGYEEAQKIMSTADKDRKAILAEAYNRAEQIKGEGDAIATKIYNTSYAIDKDFFKFYRTLIAYKVSFNKENTKFILSNDDKFLNILKGKDE
jgi:membrane protease subunit HflC